MDADRLRAVARERIRQANAVDPYYVLARRDPATAPSATATVLMVSATCVLFALYLRFRPDALVAIVALLVGLAAWYAAGIALARRRP